MISPKKPCMVTEKLKQMRAKKLTYISYASSEELSCPFYRSEHKHKDSNEIQFHLQRFIS